MTGAGIGAAGPRSGGDGPGVAVFCALCRRALNVRYAGGRLAYLHAEELRGGTCEHPARPVPLADLPDAVLECDFCSRPEPMWAYRCADRYTETRTVTATVVDARDYRHRHRAARVRRTESTPGMTAAWGQRWAACEGCAELIERRDLYGLMARVTDAMPPKLTRGKRLVRVRGELHALYSDVLATLEPGRDPIAPTPRLDDPATPDSTA
ncbi:hypothetical protein [Dactylosporangium sp. NPDC006015]|uniref:hypothetical protein n=1 Tax=Dactylosporangium sp. NPDC006015 TaxID=3154576 RepID=UPI0033ACF9BE